MGLDGVPPESKLEFYKEWNRKDSHPDFQYSRKRLVEFDIEEKLRSEFIDRALNGENFDKCPKCHAWYNLSEEIAYCPKCGYQLKKNGFIEQKPIGAEEEEADRKKRVDILRKEEEEIDSGRSQESPKAKPIAEKTREIVIRESPLSFEKVRVEEKDKGQEATSEKPQQEHIPDKQDLEAHHKPTKRRSVPVKKIVAVSIVLIILGVFLWYSPTIISIIQRNPSEPSESSYTRLKVMGSGFSSNSTTIQFGGIDYFFEYNWQPYYGFGVLNMWNSLVESKSYNLTEGAVYRDFGIETKVNETTQEYAIILVKPTVQNYLEESGFAKLTIAEGQIQDLSFGSNNYTVSYSQGHLYVATPLFQYRDYLLTIVPTTIHSDLGLEIRVSDIKIGYVVVFVKPIY